MISGTPYSRHGVLRLLLRISIILVLVGLAKFGFDWLSDRIALLEESASARAMTGLLVSVLVGYALLIAIPFVPGIEIGGALLMIQGASAAPFVYVATMAGMLIAFLIGQRASLDWLMSFCHDLRMPRICGLLQRIKSRPRDTRLASLERRLPKWLSPVLLKYRYLTIAILINTPGNIALGGGGGIMLVCGLSRLFHTGRMVLTIALATLPVPLLVWLMGTDILR